jgi:methylenetetrahydrofolate dehydrogenase (NADP+)/methenyltetrahydrofolate cyclohydrolase
MMTAEILSSKSIVERFKKEILAKVSMLKNGGITPSLTVIFVGSDGPSKAYVLSKEKTCKTLGVNFSLKEYDNNVKEEELIKDIVFLNHDSSVHGIILELPLPKTINAFNVSKVIDPQKDVDGITPINRGLLLMGRIDDTLLPVTPLSCITLIDNVIGDLSGKKVAIIGRGETVGLPLAVLLIKKSATVTVCHTKTKNLKAILKNSDIIVSATGKQGLVKAYMLSPGQIVIDAGITVLDDGRLIGDVESAASEVVAYITPVPGGVGSLTVTLLLKNLLKAIELKTH